ncbi:MAG: DUF255 domain-containing protein [Phycisphaerales bacterium]|jgi:hypothetical protein|nr:DUF255 domain-containing protein [Phycisphaerales bacterium]
MPTMDSSRAVAAVVAGLLVAATPAMPNEPTTQPHRHPANRLAGETSPYLLQHAHNPVDWYPWGEEAFEAARRENKPIFLSIGYSTCYWCHVMERQSFESPEVAAVLNAYYIPVKVDREERPDVDDIYMTAVQIMTRHGGWPLSVWLDPDTLMPFFGGTYFPPNDQGERPGFMTLLHAIDQAWEQRQPEMRAQAERVGQAVARRLAADVDTVALDAGVVDAAIAQLMASYDPLDGGYGDAPKFPMPVHLDLLLEAAWDRQDVQDSLRHTLNRMAMGGMYDQVGGGFHRYSTDGQWLVPHFEKMLYDNGMLASVYAEAYQRTGDGYYGAVVAETLDYVLREMVDDTGAFWSAQDAESNAREGESYLWTPQQIRDVLAVAGYPPAWAEFTLSVYGLDQGTNFQDPHHPGEPASNVLFLPAHPRDLAAAMDLTIPEFHDRMVKVNASLLAERGTRDQPATDDKVLVGWNGLMIGGMADGGRVLKSQRHLDAAARAADWIKSHMWDPSSGLRRTARNGRVSQIPGFLEDYAFLIRGLLKLYEATGARQNLDWAAELAGQAEAIFFDEAQGWHDTPPGDESLFVRGRSLYDGAVPSGTSVMLDNQRRLYEITGDPAWLDAADRTLGPIAQGLNRSPRGAAQAIAALHHLRAADPERFGGTPGGDAGGPVTVQARKVGAAPGAWHVEFDITSPWHVALPGAAGVMPLRIDARSPDVSIDVAWPEGHVFDGPSGEVTVLDGAAVVPIQVTGGDGASPVTIAVSWQACNDSMCLRPQTRLLQLDVGASH